MNQVIKLNRTDSFDLETLVTSRLLIQANSGGGKSWLIRRLLEQSHGKIQHIVIDLEGEFASLREKFDYILVAKEGDIQAEAKTAKKLAHRLLELNVSAIIDLYELKTQERKHYVKLFINALVDAPKRLWHPVIIIVDEAHTLCPEKGQAESADAIRELASRGRKRGFCLVLATQRLSKLHKDAAAEMNNVLIGRTGLDIDMKRAADILGFTTRDQRLLLRDLEPGSFFAFGPAISRKVTEVAVGNVKTTHPKAGGRIIQTSPKPTKKIASILKTLADLPQEAQQELKTEQDLRTEITKLRREVTLAEKARPQVVQEGPTEKETQERIKKEMDKLDAEIKERDEAFLNAIANFKSELRAALDSVMKIITRACSTPDPYKPHVRTIKTRQTTRTNKAIQPTRRPAPVNTRPQVSSQPQENGEVDLGAGGGYRMLNTLVSNFPMKFTRPQLGMLSKIKHTGGAFGNNLSKLRLGNYIIENGKYLTASQAGFDYFGAEIPQPMTSEEVIEMWRNNLGGGALRMFDVLREIYPEFISRIDLAEAIGMIHTGGGFGNCLSTLRTNCLIEEEQGTLKLSDDLFVDQARE